MKAPLSCETACWPRASRSSIARSACRRFDRASVTSAARHRSAARRSIRVGQAVGASGRDPAAASRRSGDNWSPAHGIVQLTPGRDPPGRRGAGPLADIFDIFGRVARAAVPGRRRPSRQLERVCLRRRRSSSSMSRASSPRRRRRGSRFSTRHSSWRRGSARTASPPGMCTTTSDHERALAAVQDVPAGHRLYRQAHFLASVSLLELKRYDEAFDELTRLYEQEKDSTLLNNMGVIQLRRPQGAPGGRAVSYFNEAAGLEGVDSVLQSRLRLLARRRRGRCRLVAARGGSTESRRSCGSLRPWRRTRGNRQCHGGRAREGSRKTTLVDV